jgi:predicted ATPase
MYLHTLGRLELLGGTLSRPKPLLILAYLVLEGSKERRFLSELFYQHVSDPMMSLRVALRYIHEGAEGSLETDDTHAVARLSSDVTALLAASANRDYQKVIELYQGPFLEGLSLKDLGVELEEWLYATREFIAEQVREALLRQAERQASQAHFSEAAQLAQRAYQLRGAAEAEPDSLKRIFELLLAGESLLAGEVRKAANSYHLSLDTDLATIRQRLTLKRDTTLATPHNLPTAASSFVGRDPELLELARLLGSQEVRLITVAGLGGVGKTRLSLQIAHEQLESGKFQAGVFMVFLDTANDAGRAIQLIAEALGLGSQRAGLDDIVNQINDKQMLLVLDNFEQLAAQAAFIHDLCSRCPRLKILLSSREPLQLEEEWVFSLEGLYSPKPEEAGRIPIEELEHQEALKLFVQRAKRARNQFELHAENLEAILTICHLLQGSPLSIEMAASLTKIMPPQMIAEELEHNLDILQNTHATTTRHQSLRVTFESSWERLSTSEQQLLRRLAVFRGGFSREAATAVAGASIPLLMGLAGKALLRVDDKGRYDRHPLIYRFCLEKLGEFPQDFAAYKAKHAQYFATYALSFAPQIDGPAYESSFKLLLQDFENLRSALDWSVEQEDLKLVCDIFWPIRVFWYYKGDRIKGEQVFKHLLSLPAMQAVGIPQVKLKMGAASALLDAGNLSLATALLIQIEHHSEGLNEAELQLIALRHLGDIATRQCRYNDAESYYQKGLALAKQVEHLISTISFERSAAELDYLKGHYAKAELPLQKAVVLARQFGGSWRVASALELLANNYREQGKYAEAAPLYQESIALLKDLSEDTRLAVPLKQYGVLRLYQAKFEAAKENLEKSLHLFTHQGAKVDTAICEHHLADLALATGKLEQAQLLLHRSHLSLSQLNAKAELIHLLDSYIHYFVLTSDHQTALSLIQLAKSLRSELHIGQAFYKQQLFQKHFNIASQVKPMKVIKTLEEGLDFALAHSAQLKSFKAQPSD